MTDFHESPLEGESGPERRIVLAAMDFTDTASAGLDAAIRDALQTGGALHVVHVLPPMVIAPVPGVAPPPLASSMMDLGANTSGSIPRDRTAAQREVEAHVRQHVPPEATLEIHSHVCVGKPAPEITRLAEEIGADALYVSTRGRSGLRRLVHGSVAEAVVRLAPCPVVVMRAQTASGAPASERRGAAPSKAS
jgi:nucleotide-binding universal stress UspA family protein